MATKKTETDKQPATIDELLEKGTLTLTAGSREDIYLQGDELLKDMPQGTKWTRTIVMFDGEGIFTQTYSIIKD